MVDSKVDARAAVKVAKTVDLWVDPRGALLDDQTVVLTADLMVVCLVGY
jgi:hypothetical protein